MITVFASETEVGAPIFRAYCGERTAVGQSVGMAIDAIMETLDHEGNDDSISTSMICVQRFRADRFFTEAQRTRLSSLMAMWRVARDAGTVLCPDEQSELAALVEAEQRGMIERTQAMLGLRTERLCNSR